MRTFARLVAVAAVAALATPGLVVSPAHAGDIAPLAVSTPAVSSDGKWIALPQLIYQACGKVLEKIVVTKVGAGSSAGTTYLLNDFCAEKSEVEQRKVNQPPVDKLLTDGGYRSTSYEEVFPKAGNRDVLDIDEVTFSLDPKKPLLRVTIGKKLVGSVKVDRAEMLYAVALVEGKRRWGYVQLRTNATDGGLGFTERWIAVPLKQLPWKKHPETVATEKRADAMCACKDVACATKLEAEGAPYYPAEGEVRPTRKDGALIDAARDRGTSCLAKLQAGKQ